MLKLYNADKKTVMQCLFLNSKSSVKKSYSEIYFCFISLQFSTDLSTKWIFIFMNYKLYIYLSTLVTSVVLYSLTPATLMSPRKDETRVCGYIYIYIYIYIYMWIYIYIYTYNYIYLYLYNMNIHIYVGLI